MQHSMLAGRTLYRDFLRLAASFPVKALRDKFRRSVQDVARFRQWQMRSILLTEPNTRAEKAVYGWNQSSQQDLRKP